MTSTRHDLEAELRILRRRADEIETELAAPRAPEPSGEADLGAQRASLRAVLDSLPLQTAVLDGGGRILSVNAAWAAFTRESGSADPLAGVGKRYFEGCVITRGLDGELLARTEQGLRQVLAGRAPRFDIELPNVGANAVRWFVVHVAAVPANSAGRARAVIAHLEVTERRVAEEAVRRSGALFHQLVDHGWDLVTLAGADGRIQYASAAWKRLLGAEPQALVGRFGSGLLHPDDLAARDEAVRAVLASPGATRTYEARARSRDGREIWLEVRVANLLDDPVVRAVVSAGRDVTEQKRAERAALELQADLERRVVERTAELQRANEALERASRAKDEFLAGMSHELRTPLNAVLGLSEALQEEVYGPITDRQRADHPPHRGERPAPARAHQRHARPAKIEAGKIALELAPVDVDDLCRASLRLVQEAAAQEAPPRHAPAAGRVRRDRRRRAAAEAGAREPALERGEVHARGRATSASRPRSTTTAGTLELTVWDTGIGMDAPRSAASSSPSCQLDSGLARRHAGTGLGLALVRRLVDLHGGSGRASRARPARAAASPSWSRRRARRVAPAGEDLRALRLASARRRRIAHRRGAAPALPRRARRRARASAGSGGRLDRAAAEAPDVVFLDLLLPDGAGWDVLRALKGDRRTAAIPVVLTSVLDRPIDGAAALADDYIVKPVTRARLREAMSRVAAAPPGRA